MEQKVTIQVRVPRQLAEAVAQEANANGVSLSEFVRYILTNRYIGLMAEEESR